MRARCFLRDSAPTQTGRKLYKSQQQRRIAPLYVQQQRIGTSYAFDSQQRGPGVEHSRGGSKHSIGEPDLSR